MPTSATGSEVAGARGRAAGFTLIEVLVVVAIVGILVAVAAINLFPDPRELARRQAGAVAIAIEHARDTAWFGGLPTSLTFDGGHVREWRLGGDSWRADIQHDLRLPDSVQVTAVTVDGEPLRDSQRLLFLSDGLASPFRVALAIGSLQWAVEGDAAGAVRLVGP
jgi:general secretion pathway protein H